MLWRRMNWGCCWANAWQRGRDIVRCFDLRGLCQSQSRRCPVTDKDPWGCSVSLIVCPSFLCRCLLNDNPSLNVCLLMASCQYSDTNRHSLQRVGRRQVVLSVPLWAFLLLVLVEPLQSKYYTILLALSVLSLHAWLALTSVISAYAHVCEAAIAFG